jgi:glycosyltransferase involved in cell wall biosynthesis
MEMVSQIKRLINNPDLVIQLSKNARETVEKFDWKIVKKQWFELLK